MARIVVVDDDLMVVEVLRDWLERAGHEVLSCLYWEDARTQCLHPDTAIIFADLNMPDLDGADLLLVVAQESPHVRRALITASPQQRKATEAVETGAAELILEKPFRGATLLAAVSRLLAGQPSSLH